MRIRTGEAAGSRIILNGPALEGPESAGAGEVAVPCADRAGEATGDGVHFWAMGEAGRGETLDAAGVLSRFRRS